MFADHHHGERRLAVWLPGPPGKQEMLAPTRPETYLRLPYVESRGWVGVSLGQVSARELATQVHGGWRPVAPKSLRALVAPNPGDRPDEDDHDG